jgi:cobalt-zinc-cadmium efflux system protein
MNDHLHHGHGGHDHCHIPKNETKIAIAAALTGTFMLAELVGGVVSGSLALIADAGHMLTDFASLMLAWLGFRLARRPADWKRTYGFDRFSVLAAFVNGMSLFAIAAWIMWEAIQRLGAPQAVMGGVMLWIALGGLIVNIICFWVLTRGGEGENLNVRAAVLHVMGDLLGSVAALVAALVIIWTGWTPIDPILSVLVAVIILRSALAVVRQSGHILLEGAPDGFDRRDVAETLCAEVPGLSAVSHVHAWSVTQERPIVTMSIALDGGADAAVTKAAIRTLLQGRHGIGHVTIELDT